MLIDSLKVSENPIIRKFASEEADDMLKMRAAKGLLPLESADMLRVFFLLRKDPSKEVRSALKNTFDSFKDDELSLMLNDETIEAEVLHFVSLVIWNREKPMEILLTHRNLADETVSILANRLSLKLIELITINQDRLIRSSSIINNLIENKNITPAIEMRLIETVRRYIEKVEPESLVPENEIEDPVETVSREEIKSEHNETVGSENAQEIKKPEIRKPGKKDNNMTAYQKVSRMNVAQKIVTAFKGTKEERGLLIRDSNKIVAMTVLHCPKVQAGEAELFAQLRNVPQEVLGTIAKNKEWMKSYQVTLNLLKNPRSPFGVVQANVSRLMTKDLDNLQKDKNVSEAVRRTAKQEYQKRTQRNK